MRVSLENLAKLHKRDGMWLRLLAVHQDLLFCFVCIFLILGGYKGTQNKNILPGSLVDGVAM